MIHGHHFYFIDQPTLQEEYLSFGFSKKLSGKDVIRVKEIDSYRGFEYRSFLRSLSAKDAYYLFNNRFEDIKKGVDWGLEALDTLTLVWDSKNRDIYYFKSKNFNPSLLKFWIWHTFFPLTLDFEGDFTLFHVGAIEVDGSLILFSADSYGGKSTLTDYFIKMGHTLFSDDALAIKRIENRYIAYPAYPYHRPFRETEKLGYRVQNFAKESKEIKAIFELVPTTKDAKVEIYPIKGLEKFQVLNYSHFTKFYFLKHKRFSFAMDMAKYVPVFKITIPWDKARLNEVYRTIVEFLKN